MLHFNLDSAQTIADGVVDLNKTKWTNDQVDSDRFMQWGDILFSHINSFDHLAKTAIYTCHDSNVIHGINLIRFRPDQSRINPLYAAYLFKQDSFKDKAKSFAQRAVNQASIKTSDLRTIKIPVPPLDVQKEIVAEIESYQKIIDGARQVAENYKPRIQIDPEWPMVEIKDISDVESGFGFSLELQGSVGKPFPFLKVSDMNLAGNETYITTENNSVDAGDLAKMKAKTFPAGTVIFPKIGAAIATNKKRILTKESTFDNNVMGIVPNTEKLVPEFLYYWLVQFDLSLWASQSQPPSMRKSVVEEYKIPCPAVEIQRDAVAALQKEEQLVNASKQLVALFEAKVKAAINRVWEEAK